MTSPVKINRFIVLGDAGAGKTSLINLLYNYHYGTKQADEIFCAQPKVKLAIPCANWVDYLDDRHRNNNSEFNIHDQTQSQTKLCTKYAMNGELLLEIIDTPGFNDTNSADLDEKNLLMIENALKEVPFLTGIIMVVNGSVPRLGVSFKNFLYMLHQVWPNDLQNNCVAILTNCDELSVNLDPAVLKQSLNINKSKTFYLQNSLFRWDPTNQSPKAMRRFRQDFEDNAEIIEELLKTLSQFNDVSTQSFEIGAIKILLIENYIVECIVNMLDLIRKYKEQQVVESGIVGAQNTMKKNQQWEKHREIKAICWVKVPKQQPPESPQMQLQHGRRASVNTRHKASSSCKRSSEPTYPGNGQINYTHSNSNAGFSPGHFPATVQHGLCPRRGSQHDNAGLRSSVSNRDLAVSKTSGHSSRTTPESCSPQATSGFCSYMSTDQDMVQQEGGKRDDDYQRQNHDHKQRPFKLSNSSLNNRCDVNDHQQTYSRSSNEPVYQQQHAKIQVTLPDNEARSQHEYAAGQVFELREKTHDLFCRQQQLQESMTHLLDHLEQKVVELRSLNNNYDIIERNRDSLRRFKEVVEYGGDVPGILQYYEETVAIMSKSTIRNHDYSMEQ